MDKKNTILGLIFILAGMGYMFWQGKEMEKQRLEQLQQEETLEAPVEDAMPDDAVIEPVDPDAVVEAKESVEATDLFEKVEALAVPDAPLAEEKTVQLANEFIEATLTTRGGAIQTVEFLTTKRGEPDDYVFNQDGYLPALSLSLGSEEGDLREFALDYQIEKQSEDSVTFALDMGDGFIVRRTYRIAPSGSDAEPYVIQHETTFSNSSAVAKPLKTIYFNLGTARPISREMIGVNFLNVGYFNGEDAEFIPIKELTGSSGFLGIGGNSPQDEINEKARVEWASVKNQFFASVLSSESLGGDVYIYPVEAPQNGDKDPGRPGITGSVGYDVGNLAAGETRTMSFEFFVGPKEFKRLQALGNNQDLVMQFGKVFGFFSKILLVFMYAIHSFVPSWGWSIVIMTICIKILFWPLTSKASRSQKRMAKIQQPMAELKEKYKDNPQKMQQETLKLFKEHQVNPVAGCLPMLVQMPIFLGLFYMLRTASELRYERFLWVSDLSMPDTLTEVAGFPINILPLIMGFTMFLQMSMMPVSPTADPMQQKIFKFLPFVFLVFLYNFSSGLVLYWTVQNILTIIQQKIINSRPDEPLKPVAVAEAPKKGKGGSPRTKAKKK